MHNVPLPNEYGIDFSVAVEAPNQVNQLVIGFEFMCCRCLLAIGWGRCVMVAYWLPFLIFSNHTWVRDEAKQPFMNPPRSRCSSPCCSPPIIISLKRLCQGTSSLRWLSSQLLRKTDGLWYLWWSIGSMDSGPLALSIRNELDLIEEHRFSRYHLWFCRIVLLGYRSRMEDLRQAFHRVYSLFHRCRLRL